VLVLVALPTPARAYRPFVSTDAAVADVREVEIELGYFNLDRSHRENTISTPHTVLNYGVAKNLEVVAEFNLEVSPDVEVVDPGVFLKGVVKEGVLQDKPGVSVAIEAGPLLPSTRAHERRVGFEAVGIVSGRVSAVTLHVNGGGGVDRDERHAFGVWGVIGELPVHPKLRVVGEVAGESIQAERLQSSALLGVIWQPTARNIFLDAGVRRGLTQAAPDWEVTLGLTFGFAVPPAGRQ
jgi:hypothetical protein